MINFKSIKVHNFWFQQYIKRPKKITHSDNLSITESKKPPNFVDLSVNLAIAPSTPSIIPVINIKIAKITRFKGREKKSKNITLLMANANIIIVAKFGETPILLNPLAISFTTGLNMYRNRNFDGMFQLNFSFSSLLKKSNSLVIKINIFKRNSQYRSYNLKNIIYFKLIRYYNFFILIRLSIY